MTDEQWAAWAERGPEDPDDDGVGDSDRDGTWASWQASLLMGSALIGAAGTVAVGVFGYVLEFFEAMGCAKSGHCMAGPDLLSAAVSLVVLVGCSLLAIVIGNVHRLRLVFVLACATMVVVPIAFLVQLL